MPVISSISLPRLAALVCISAALPHARGAAIAYDDASALVYATDWANGQNGGSGFEPWVMTPSSDSGQGGFFVQDSGTNAQFSPGNINTGGQAWGMYNNGGGITDAIRQFTAGGPNGTADLEVGQQFIISMDNGFIGNGGAVGFGLRNAAGQNRIEFLFFGGEANYTVNEQADQTTAHEFTGAGLQVAFTLTGADTYQLDVTFNAGTPATESFTGVLEGDAGSGIDRFRLFNFRAGSGADADAYFNAVQVVPEPAAAMALLAGGAMLGLRRRRRG